MYVMAGEHLARAAREAAFLFAEAGQRVCHLCRATREFRRPI